VTDRVKHFTDLRVWRQAHELFLALLRDVDSTDKSAGSRMLAEQMLRSCASICANVAEGFNRSRARYLNSLDIALGEANETENWLYKARDAGLLPADVARERLLCVIEIERMLAALRKSIRASEDRAQEGGADYELWEPDER
jgi:four helix bundle protein